MKTAALAGLAALTLFDFASAPAVQAQSFEGAYGGVHAGIRMHQADVAIFGTTYDLSSTSALFGAHVGYNTLVSPEFLIGVEVDGDIADNEDTYQLDSFDGFSVRSQFQGTLRARAGLVSGASLFFATAGLAFADFEWKPVAASGASEDVLTGWVVGAGFETFVASNTILRLDYLHEDFGEIDVIYGGSTGTVDNTIDKVRVGVSFKF